MTADDRTVGEHGARHFAPAADPEPITAEAEAEAELRTRQADLAWEQAARYFEPGGSDV